MSLIAKWLFAFTENRKCRLIHRGSDERYLERYWLGEWRSITAVLHRFVARDADEWVHDHPWSWAIAIVLTGRYREERLKAFSPNFGWISRWRRMGGFRRINIIRGSDFHRIVDCEPNTWTLFIYGPRIKVDGREKGWGFLEVTNDGVMYHQPYNRGASRDWHKRMPIGKDANRAPLKVAA